DTTIPLQIVLASVNLERWSSPNTFVQVDNGEGYPLAKSSNMGALTFPPAQVTPEQRKVYARVQTSRGTFLVESELFSSGARRFVARVGEPMDQLQRAFAQTRQALIIIIALAVALVILLSAILASQAVNPINELALAMRGIGSDRLNRRLKWKNRQDEVGRLAETFDDLLARLEEAFARERQFISDASHELKTPLTSINANAQMLVRWGDRDKAVLRESLQTIVQESAALAEMVNGMLTLAKADSGDAIPKELLSLSAVAGDAVQATSQRAVEKGLDLRLESSGSDPVIYGEPTLVRQLISNLIDNAIKFTERGGVTVRVGSNGSDAFAEVRDTGRGIAAEELPFVFDRFYRADKSRNRDVPGTGLGLAIVRSIARVHDGRVEAERAPGPGTGTVFRAHFPVANAGT
ncbi:MAG: HAMP domain-containing histidine kinase, partial [Candidatus Eremiobacteraeota bacterium]|nr:HAMP domain-containing histidine kinase [Candidatus Eremiobacteraeota bacterium]